MPFSSTGNWSGLSASFILERKSSYFFLNLYAPCALIVLMSWMSFYLPYEQYPARIALGVTAVLTTVTILSMFNNTMPKVRKTTVGYFLGFLESQSEIAIAMSLLFSGVLEKTFRVGIIHVGPVNPSS